MKRTLFSLLAVAASAIAAAAAALFKPLGEVLYRSAEAHMARTGLMLHATTYGDVYSGVKPARNQPITAEPLELVVPFWLGTTNGTVAPVVNDIVALCEVPAGVEIADWIIQSEDADSNGTPTLDFTLGSLNAGLTDISTTYLAAVAVGKTGGVTRATTTAHYTEANTAKRVIGIKWTTAAATFVAGKKGLLVLRLVG
jgi:hypothetical protein